VRRYLVRFGPLRALGRRWYRHQRRNPPRTPEGWEVAAPDFVGVGVQKAGTTWWYELIAAHPRVSHHARPKELHFFDRYWAKPFTPGDAATYHRYFPRPPGMLAGEWTPGYLSLFWLPAQLRLAAPDTRLLVMLRDPVERYRSGLTLAAAASNGKELPATRAKEAFRRGLYAEQLELLFEHFPPSQVLVLQYERARDEPLPDLARTYGFLGIDADFVPESLSEERNPAFGPRLEVPDEVREQLVDAYTPDVKRLLALVPDTDLQLWPNFRHLA
jgi:Sulfotransferase domain